MQYYVYGIVDPDEVPPNLNSISDLLGSIIYVGKGTGDRLRDHTRQAAQILAQELGNEGHPRRWGGKLNRLLEILRSGREPMTVKLMADLESERDAYIAETFAIESINAHRCAIGREPLTNEVAGHGLAIEPLANYVSRFDVQPVQMEPATGQGTLAILVKGNSNRATENHYEADPAGSLPFLNTDGRAVAMRFLEKGDSRPGWDPHLPWTTEQAAARARRYWPIGLESIERWVREPNQAPRYVLLAINDNRRTVIRYIWHIDLDKPWEFYADFNPPRWGIPMGEPVTDHPLLNTEPRIGARHALHSVSSGYRQVRFS